jgi:hypothetical protein
MERTAFPETAPAPEAAETPVEVGNAGPADPNN